MHGFDLTLPASANGHVVCVTAINVGSGANNKICGRMDEVVEFEAFAINYDTDHAVLTGVSLEQLDRVTNRNDTAIQQSTEISDSKTVTNTVGCMDTFQCPDIGLDDLQYRNRSRPRHSLGHRRRPVQLGARRLHRTHPDVLLAAAGAYAGRSMVVATVTAAAATSEVPYTLAGDYVTAPVPSRWHCRRNLHRR